jgi:hypothetical protein
MRISRERLDQILSDRNRNFVIALLGLSGGGLLAVSAGYLVHATDLSPDLMAKGIIALLVLFWLGVAAMNSADARRAEKIERILAHPGDVRMVFDPKTRKLNLRQMGRIDLGDGQLTDAVLETANLTVEEAERISAAMNSASQIRLLAAPAQPGPAAADAA